MSIPIKNECQYNDCGWCYSPQSEYTHGCVGAFSCVYLNPVKQPLDPYITKQLESIQKAAKDGILATQDMQHTYGINLFTQILDTVADIKNHTGSTISTPDVDIDKEVQRY